MSDIMGRRVFALYMLVFVIMISTITIYQTNDNASAEFDIIIIYQEHSWTETFSDYDHEYDTITITAQVTVSDYPIIFNSLRVGSYPFWLDVSQWENGGTATIGSSSYDISSSGGLWSARRSLGGADYVNLFYEATTGVFLSSYSKVSGSGVDFLDDYIREITTESSNLGSLSAAISGMNVIVPVGLIVGIFFEIPIMLYLYKRWTTRS